MLGDERLGFLCCEKGIGGRGGRELRDEEKNV